MIRRSRQKSVKKLSLTTSTLASRRFRTIHTVIRLVLVVILLIPITDPILTRIARIRNIDKRALMNQLSNTAASERADINLEDDNPEWMRGDQIHPYLGFTNGDKRENAWLGITTDYRNDNEITIALFGGSVAYYLNESSAAVLINELKKYPLFMNKEIRILSSAIGGYKQPQQLIAFNLMLITGHTIHIALNIDGFNDIVLPYSDNNPSHITPYYPRLWNLYSRKGLPVGAMKIIYELQQLRDKQRDIARFFNGFLHRYTVTLLMWNALNTNYENRIHTQSTALETSLAKTEHAYQTTGPDYDIGSATDLFEYSATIWANGSRQMYKLAKENGIVYIHILQPNQWLMNSKPFSQTEHRLMESVLKGNTDTSEYKYAEAVSLGYPILTAKGAALKHEGVPFYDGTNLFSNYTQTLYSDTCCHYTKEGYDILANYAAQLIVQSYGR